MPRWTFALALVLLTAGCGGHARPDTSDLDAALAPTAQVEGLRLPFDAYSPSLATLYTISNAEDRLTGACMRARGQEWKSINRPTGMKDLRNRRRYGVIEPAIAQHYGYHVPAGLLTPLEVEQQYDAREKTLTDTQKDAAYGDGGCGSDAAAKLRPAANTEEDALINQLDRKSLDDSQQTPEVAAALTSWRNCMTKAGHTYSDPFAAISDTRWWADESAGPSPAELAVAVADVHCKQQSHLVDLWQAAEVRIQQDLIAQNADYFKGLSAAMEQELTTAKAVLARG